MRLYRAQWLLAALLLAAVTLAACTCAGNECPEQHEAAKSSKLLGNTASNAGSLRDCPSKKYPSSGTLLPVSIPSRILDLRWAPGPNGTANRKYIYALTVDKDGFSGGPLWRSDNYGAADSWRDQTGALAAAMPSGEATATGILTLVWHKDKPDRLLYQGKGRFHFVSTDGGATYKAQATPGNTLGAGNEIKTHPRQADWLLAKARRDECAADRHSAACAYDLFISKDFGASWQNLTEASGGKVVSFRDFEWGAHLAMFAGKPTPDDAIFATAYVSASKQKGLYPGWDKDLHYVVSLDLFKSPFAKTVACGNLFEVVAHKVFLAVPSDCPVGPDGRARKAPSKGITGRTVTMYVSDADGDDFTEACLPINLEDDGYNMVRTHDGYGAFVLADHAEPGSRGPTSDSPVSDAYAPAYNASFFTISLPNVYRREYVTDFTRVETLPGVYIANQVDKAALGPQPSRVRYADFLQTRISVNGGATWQPLPLPKSYRYGQCNTCGAGAGDPGQCSLHLHGPSSWFAPEGPRPNVYSHESAPGLLIATGNVGPHLDFASGASCTWVSHDGGLNWEDVSDHAAIYEMGDHGGVIVMAQHKTEGPTDKVRFSSDGGTCWADVQLPEALNVENIRTDPEGQGHAFFVHGSACLKTASRPDCTFEGGAQPPSRMFVIDVAQLMGGDYKECDKAPGSPSYEDWALLGGDQRCLLGAQYSLRRRKRDAGCFNGDGYPGAAPALTQQCNCTLADTECEYGYQPDANGTCTKITDVGCSTCPALMMSGYKVSSTNRRLVHADTCVGLGTVIPDTDGKGDVHGGGGKGGSGGRSFWGRFFLFLLVAGILGVVGYLAWAHCLGQGLQERLAAGAAPLLAGAAAAFEFLLDGIITVWDWARAKWAALRGRSAAASAAQEAGYFEPLAEDDYQSPPLFPPGGARV